MSETYLSHKSMQPSPLRALGETCFVLPPRELLRPRRLDLIVKWRLFSNITDPETINVYLWHIARRRASGFVDSTKNGLEVFMPQARNLLASMAMDGYDPAYPVPVDSNNDILGGAHRTACALALGINVLIDRRDTAAWAPAWDAAWFRQHGMPEGELEGLIADYERLKSKEA